MILWRDALAMIREPARLGWAALFAAAAVVEALTHPGRALPAGVAAVALYFAASLLSEPLRIDVDAPDTGALLLSWPFARLLIAHCALPILALSAIAATAIVAHGARGRCRRRRARPHPDGARADPRHRGSVRRARGATAAGASTRTCSGGC